MSLDQYWRELNAIVCFALESGMEIEHDDSELQVYVRWAEIKARFEAGSET